MDGYFAQASSFLISTIIGFYIILLLLRFLLQVVGADFYNALSQFLVKVTNPLVVPMRRYIPGLYGLDMSTLLLAYLLQCIETGVMVFLSTSAFPLVAILWFALGQLLGLFLYIYMIAIIIQAVMSWINPMQNYHPISALISQLTEPVIRPVRKFVPPFSGIDFSPFVVLIVINLLIMLIPFIFH